MNGADLPEKPSGFLLGKEFIIVIVIVFSGLSFTLGFFVGKSSIDAGPRQSLKALENPAEPDRREASQGAVTPEAPVQEPRQSATKEALSVREEPPSGTVMHQAQPVPALKQKEDAKAGISEKSPSQAVAKTALEKPTSKNEALSSAAEQQPTFTVQIGAFKNPADARHLKARFEKKGFKTYIVTTKDEKGRIVYKVRTGEYSDKKEADVLALKLSKTEGLTTYVTSRSE